MDAPRYENLSALLVNCSLTPDPERSHTGRLLDVIDQLMSGAGAQVDRLHAAHHDIATGVQPDMREHGAESDEWPELWPRVQAADILILGTPIWLGEESSQCRRFIERLYAMSGQLNEAGQSVYYGKVGGAVITGNEDGVKHTSMSLLFALQHLGLMIPPQADVGWLGEIGPGPSYGDPREGQRPVGFDSAFTRQNATIMSWNLMHTANMLRLVGGLPNYGNDRNALQSGEMFGYTEPKPIPGNE